MQLIKMSRRWRHCGITQTLIRVFVRGHKMRAAHPSSQPSILLHSLLLSLHSPLLLLVHGNHTSSYDSPYCPRRLRSFSATFYTTLISFSLPFAFSIQPIDSISSQPNGCDLTPGIVIKATCALPFSHFDFSSVVIPSFFYHCSGKDFISAPTSLLRADKHTHMNYTMSALFLLSLQASRCLLKSCCSCSTPPTCNIDSSENHLPLLILLSPHFSVFTHSL